LTEFPFLSDQRFEGPFGAVYGADKGQGKGNSCNREIRAGIRDRIEPIAPESAAGAPPGPPPAGHDLAAAAAAVVRQMRARRDRQWSDGTSMEQHAQRGAA
jgi:hypothetical protein